MEQNCLAGAQKSGFRSRILYRVAAVGIATLITQASPGGAASSWGVECLTTDLANNSYCVTSLNDDTPSDSAAWTLRKSVEDANTRAAASATIGFQDALFSAATSSDNAKLVLNSTLEIKTNITITAPTDSGGSPLLTIVRGDSVASGAPLIAISPTADAHPATLTTGPAANQATEEVRIENVNIQARANTENPQGSGFAGQTQESANPGVTIQVKETISVTSTESDVVAPTVVLVNTTISNAVSESGGAAINTPGNVRVEGSTLVGNVAITPSGGAPTDGGAIKAGGTVTVISSALNNNSATGNGGAISASSVSVSSAQDSSNSQLIGNTAGGSGGAVSAAAQVTVSASTVSSNIAKQSGGAISAGDQVMVSTSTLNNNTAELGTGGAISTTAYAAVSISGSELKTNSAFINGGAIAARGAVEVSASTLNNNTAELGNGGAISTVGAVTVSASTLNSNTAELGSGGAISTIGAVTVSETSTISTNTAKENGGAISALGAVTVTASTLNSNTAESGSGGAISTRGEVTVSASTLNSNTATLGSGGAISTVVSVAVIETSTVSSNTAKENGGAINAGGDVLVAQSALSNNTATTGDGGAISTVADVTVLNSSTLSSNISNDNGGAISAGGQVEVSTSILNGNTATTGDGGAISAGGQVTVSASNLNSNEALEGHGGAVFSGDKVITLSTTSFEENSADFGGAISAITSVSISETAFIDNSASESGGAILVDSESNEESTISKSTFAVNSAEFGGAIYAGAAINLSETEFFLNTAFESGGAIYAEGNVAVIDSVFGINIESDLAAQEEPETQSNVAYLGQGGAIYSESKVTTTRSGFVQNFSGSGGGAIAAEQTVSVNGSIFVGNGSFGDGGAVYATGGVIVENGSVLLANTAGVNPESEFGFGFFYPIFLDGLVFFELDISGGNGGAIYSAGDVMVSGSTIGLSPPLFGQPYVFANKALCAQTFREDGDESGWSQECEREEYYYDPEFESHNYELVPVGNGGGIYALGKVTIEGGNTTINIDLDVLSLLDIFIAKEDSFEKSYLTNNYAQNKGGAVYALGGISVSDAVFGTEPVENLNYNPERSRKNPNYVPGNYVSSTMLNPICEGQPYYGYGDDFCEIGDASHPWSISNPEYEPEYFYDLDDDTKEQDSYKYNYAGNSSGDDGGAIYVEGITTINNSTFQGNTSGDDGGAIYSEGTLEVEDSGFNRNWAEDDGGAIRATPGDGDLFITRTSFTENVSMDDGGAIYISTGSVEHYDDVILSSLFRENEAFGNGGAVESGYVVLILNTFEDNKSLEGQSLNLSGGYLSGNVLIGGTNGQDLCLVSGNVIAANNFGTDESCFEGSSNYFLTRVEITEEGALHTLPEEYEATLLGELKGNEEFFLEVPSPDNPNGVLAPLGTFITNELNKDFKLLVRDSTVSWTAGHLQGIFPDLINEPEVDNTEGDTETVMPKDQEQNSQEQTSGSNNQGVVNQPDPTNPDSPVLIFEPTLSAEEFARISQLRAEQLAAELLRQKEAERIAADNLAKIKAAKLARDKARALAAEKRRAQLAALRARIAATQARGEALKQKPSWINLMKNSSNSNSAKGLVRAPIK